LARLEKSGTTFPAYPKREVHSRHHCYCNINLERRIPVAKKQTAKQLQKGKRLEKVKPLDLPGVRGESLDGGAQKYLNIDMTEVF
jgi:hypothetical protein